MSQQSLDYQPPARAKAMPRVMRVFALILSAAGLLLLLVVADLRWGFVRLPVGGGLESGLIGLSLAWVSGLAVSAAAVLLAFLGLRWGDRVRSSRWLLAWCCVLVLGFGLVFVV
jgi:hypothetical protein